MCDNAGEIITNNFECDKIISKPHTQKETYSAEEYYAAFLRKSKSENSRPKDKAEYFLDLALTHKNAKAVWLIDKANYGDYNSYQKLIFLNKAFRLEPENPTIQKVYLEYKDKYESLKKQAKLHSELITNNPKLTGKYEWNKHSNLYVVKLEDTYFIYHKSGKVTSPEEKIFLLNEFNNGVSIFFKENNVTNPNNNYCGLIDTNGRVITKQKYALIESFSDGLALARDTNGLLFLNSKGENAFKRVFSSASSFKNGIARVSEFNSNKGSSNSSIQVNSKIHFIDLNGEQIFTGDNNLIGDYSEGLALARNSKGELVFLNSDGNTAFKVNSKYKVMHDSKVSDFSSGFCLLRINTKKFCYLNKRGEVEFKTSYINPRPFKENRAMVSKFENQKVTFSFIDEKGLLIDDFKYEMAFNFSEGRATVKKKEKYGVIDMNGDIIIPFIYSYPIEPFQNGKTRILHDGKFIGIDINGNIIN
jgi:hypothetical protein